MQTNFRLISCTRLPNTDNLTVVVWDGKQNLSGTIPETEITSVLQNKVVNLTPLVIGLHEAGGGTGSQRKTG